MRIKFIFLTILLSGCGLVDQMVSMKNLNQCQFKISGIENIHLAGVNVTPAKVVTDLNILDKAKILANLAKGSLPLKFTINVDVNNPNPVKAAMSKFEWILKIDDSEILNGEMNKYVEIAPNTSNTFPLEVEMDLVQIFKGEKGKDLLDFALNLSGLKNGSSRVTLKAKPTIYIGKLAVPYPGYINISREFGKEK